MSGARLPRPGDRVPAILARKLDRGHDQRDRGGRPAVPVERGQVIGEAGVVLAVQGNRGVQAVRSAAA